MLNSDAVTFDSLKKLWGLASRSDRKPLVIWVGAGASSWLGYERWEEVANRFHRSFARSTVGYQRADAAKALAKGDYPAVFQLCFIADPNQYRSLLVASFSPRPVKPVYKRFLDAVQKIGVVS